MEVLKLQGTVISFLILRNVSNRMCVCVYVSAYVCMHVCVYICMYVCVCMYVCMCELMYVCMHFTI